MSLRAILDAQMRAEADAAPGVAGANERGAQTEVAPESARPAATAAVVQTPTINPRSREELPGVFLPGQAAPAGSSLRDIFIRHRVGVSGACVVRLQAGPRGPACNPRQVGTH